MTKNDSALTRLSDAVDGFPNPGVNDTVIVRRGDLAAVLEMLSIAIRAMSGSSDDDTSDEESDPHSFTSRTRYESGDDRDIWCADCEYHRDHPIHTSFSTTSNGTPALDAVGKPASDTSGELTRGKVSL